MTLHRQVACTPITPTLTRTQCASHTEVVHVVRCGVEEIGEESSSTSCMAKVANSCVTHHVVHHLTTDQMCELAVCIAVCASRLCWDECKQCKWSDPPLHLPFHFIFVCCTQYKRNFRAKKEDKRCGVESTHILTVADRTSL